MLSSVNKRRRLSGLAFLILRQFFSLFSVYHDDANKRLKSLKHRQCVRLCSSDEQGWVAINTVYVNFSRRNGEKSSRREPHACMFGNMWDTKTRGEQTFFIVSIMTEWRSDDSAISSINIVPTHKDSRWWNHKAFSQWEKLEAWNSIGSMEVKKTNNGRSLMEFEENCWVAWVWGYSTFKLKFFLWFPGMYFIWKILFFHTLKFPDLIFLWISYLTR